jgi:hypothetical protein
MKYKEDFIPRDIIEIIEEEYTLRGLKKHAIFLKYESDQNSLEDLNNDKIEKINARADTTSLDKVSKGVATLFNKDVIQHVLGVKEIDNESVEKIKVTIIALSAFSYNNKDIKKRYGKQQIFQRVSSKT